MSKSSEDVASPDPPEANTNLFCQCLATRALLHVVYV